MPTTYYYANMLGGGESHLNMNGISDFMAQPVPQHQEAPAQLAIRDHNFRSQTNNSLSQQFQPLLNISSTTPQASNQQLILHTQVAPQQMHNSHMLMAADFAPQPQRLLQ